MEWGIWAGKGVCFLLLLAGASWNDIRTRQVPDRYSVMVFMLALIFPDIKRFWGILCACPLLAAALMTGDIGGADIKIMGAAGMVLGLERGTAALVLGLSCMLIFHAGRVPFLRSGRKRQSYPLIPFLAVGMGIEYLTLIPL